jgi:hypothetical protein
MNLFHVNSFKEKFFLNSNPRSFNQQVKDKKMVDPKLNEIIQAEQLMNEGKKEKALKIVRVLQQKAWNYSYTNPDKALEIEVIL